jgi:hypothetical protein
MELFSKLLNKNSWAFGAFIATITPVLALFSIYAFFLLISNLLNLSPFSIDRFFLLSLTANLLLMRYYLVGIKKVKTGKSILAVTFLLVLLFFFATNSL